MEANLTTYPQTLASLFFSDVHLEAVFRRSFALFQWTYSLVMPILYLVILFYGGRKILKIFIFFLKLRKLPQNPSHFLYGHIRTLKPPPWNTGIEFGRDLRKILDRSKDFLDQHGFMVFWFSWYPTVIVTNPAIIEKLFSASIEKGPGFDIARTFFGDGLVMQHPKKWKARRKFLSVCFHGPVISQYIPVMNEVTQKWIKELPSRLNEPLNVMRLCQKIGMDIICATTMGISEFAEGSPEVKYRSAIEVAVEMILMRVINPLYWFDAIFALTKDGKRSSVAQKFIQHFSNSLIKAKTREQKSNKTPNIEIDFLKTKFSLLDHLVRLSIPKEGDTSKATISLNGIREEVNTTLFAGNESTASTMAWTLFLLGCHPDIQQKVFEELCDVIPLKADKQNIQNDKALKDLKFLECCIKESMRICPSIHTITRRLQSDLVFDSHTIPSGTVASICIYYIHRNPRYYPNPDLYIPERFLPGNELCNRPANVFIPFGFGQRQCIGQTMAFQMIKIVVSEFIRNFEIQSISSLAEVQREAAFLGTFKPSKPVQVILKPRIRRSL